MVYYIKVSNQPHLVNDSVPFAICTTQQQYNTILAYHRPINKILSALVLEAF